MPDAPVIYWIRVCSVPRTGNRESDVKAEYKCPDCQRDSEIEDGPCAFWIVDAGKKEV